VASYIDRLIAERDEAASRRALGVRLVAVTSLDGVSPLGNITTEFFPTSTRVDPASAGAMPMSMRIAAPAAFDSSVWFPPPSCACSIRVGTPSAR
jgi:hypothetical protein